MRGLIVGIDSTIGRAAAEALARRGHRVQGTSRRGTMGALALDLAQLPSPLVLPAADVGLLCAAETSQERCRTDEPAARRINAEAPACIAVALAAQGGRAILLSSNAVFDGSRERRPAGDAPCPVNAYGRHKAEAEAAVLACPGGAALRLTKVLAPGLPLFAGWRTALLAGRPITAAADMVFAPLALAEVAGQLAALAEAGVGGLFQMSACRDISYAEACRHLARRLGADPGLVRAVPAASLGIAAEHRPRHTTLDCAGLTALTGWTPPDPLDVIEALYGAAMEKEGGVP